MLRRCVACWVVSREGLLRLVARPTAPHVSQWLLTEERFAVVSERLVGALGGSSPGEWVGCGFAVGTEALAEFSLRPFGWLVPRGCWGLACRLRRRLADSVSSTVIVAPSAARACTRRSICWVGSARSIRQM